MDDRDFIELRGVRVHNLQGVSVSFPLNRWSTVTGVSGSGKSSLVIDTLFAESRRRYAQSLGARASELVRGLEKPDADEIGPLPPAVMLPQTPPPAPWWATVASLAELLDPLCALLGGTGIFHCPTCERPLRPCASDELVEWIMRLPEGHRIMIGFPLWPPSRAAIVGSDHRAGRGARRAERGFGQSTPAQDAECPASWQDALSRADQAGFRRWVCVRRDAREKHASHDGRVLLSATLIDGSEGLREFAETERDARADLEAAEWWAVVDRLRSPLYEKRDRVAEAVEAAYEQGRGRCVVLVDGAETFPQTAKATGPGGFDRTVVLGGRRWGVRDAGLVLHCPICRSDYCMPNARELRPLRYRTCAEEPDAVAADGTEPRAAGPCPVCGGTGGGEDFQSVVAVCGEEAQCAECAGTGLNDVARAVRLPERLGGTARCGPNIADLLTWTAGQCGKWLARWTGDADDGSGDDGGNREVRVPIPSALEAVRLRLEALEAVGLDYLPLRRPIASLGTSERRRVELVRLLATTLVHALYVLDEPGFGVHRLDRPAIVRAIRALTERPATVVVVEHAAEFIQAADRVVVLGPGAGSAGGRVIAVEDRVVRRDQTQPPRAEGQVARARAEGTAGAAAGNVPGTARSSLHGVEAAPAFPEGEHLASVIGDAGGERAARTPAASRLRIHGARAKNLSGWNIEIPLQALCTITGVGGAGKTALLRDTIAAALVGDRRAGRRRLQTVAESAADGGEDAEADAASASRLAEGPVVEVVSEEGAAFDAVSVVDDTRPAGTLRSCVGSYLKCYDNIRRLMARTADAVELGLTARSFSFNVAAGRCERCHGLGTVTVDMRFLGELTARCPDCQGRRFSEEVLEVHFRGRSIADILQMTVDEAFVFFRGEHRIQRVLQRARDVGLGYLTLGQPLVTLSGGELQRIKLARELAGAQRSSRLFLIDFPSGGLHEDDLRRLVALLRTLTRVGHSVIVADHHPVLCDAADWIVELGPGGGPHGGSLLYCGPRSGWSPKAC